MTRSFFFVWVASVSLAALCVQLLLAIEHKKFEIYARDIGSTDTSEILFIGSSLTQNILPSAETPYSMLGDGRSAAIRIVGNISERMSNALLANAIEAGTETVFLEANAYFHDLVALTEPAMLGRLTSVSRKTSESLKRAVSFRSKFGPVGEIRNDGDEVLDCRQLQSGDYYRMIRLAPDNPDRLHALLAHARDLGVYVYFFATPRPACIVNRMGTDEYSDLLAHVDRMAAFYGVPIWRPAGAWPDEYFRDGHAHANIRGRQRFQQELSHWYRARP